MGRRGTVKASSDRVLKRGGAAYPVRRQDSCELVGHVQTGEGIALITIPSRDILTFDYPPRLESEKLGASS